jgi:hypothetical protein
MNAGEIVPRYVEVNGGFKVREFLGKSVHQPSETPKVHSDTEVLALDVAGANVIEVRVSADWAVAETRLAPHLALEIANGG